ncbi:4-aminobutyrate--2-oxoglutarate transaminase [Frankia sp. CcI156]|uniref:(S)-3-amino-2-methylpropionate transaminase n=1 Tax=Frankia casuarinae (strain DSM 45818 / CECT 9043 / HFP020203 / CcI3) TaxID=106370 RepID=Q2J6B8_FRACC|nr:MULTISPECIES: 4-aminobutyrate--2-oxoglutarate transaminase [Frankia]ABD13174.1 4-aminobutyrate aminotransferase apoenzyme [Frankia casuarinae]ETA00574.1 4-aminobutyrate aminotransferase apoenzyme [Frankia sp. CcI6]EYT89904.1 4-aminobutyrate aminotransferase apoenzyme [Frankia casuarinae]KDA41534.1 4-aminobutyrate aminotransferase apoenzyme [Frankia sp. BMG5.23]OFB40529.1 4-aminobutyrate transaminase [Frankia sp. CgIM4]
MTIPNPAATGIGLPATGGPRLPQEPRLHTEIPGPRSRALAARRVGAVARGVGETLPVYAHAAGGGVVVDVDGNSLIDFGSGIAVVSVGNAADGVVEAVREQIGRFTHTCFMVTPYEGYIAVCEALNRLTPGTHEKRSALFNSGAEAVENAVKIARSATGRGAVVVFEHAYHGRTNLTMAMTAKSMPYKSGFGPFAPEVYRMPLAYPYRWPTGPDRCGEEAAERVIELVRDEIGAASVAAMVIEPIQGEGGFIVPGTGFLPRLAEFCTVAGIVFVADEVQTGFARTGTMFACEHEGVVPDLITTAKGIAGGLPLAAVTGRAEIMDAPQVGGLGGTYGGNPAACAAALAAIDLIESEDLAGRARRIGEIALPRLHALRERYDFVGDVRGRGAMVALELVRGAGDDSPDKVLTAAAAAACHRRGLIVLTAGTWGNVLRLLPPLVIEEPLLLAGLDLLDEAFAELAARRQPPSPARPEG